MCIYVSIFQNVIDIPKQVEYFKEYKKRLELAIGKEKMEKHIKKAGFVISAGTNDFVVNYFIIPIRRNTYTVSAYQQFVFQKAKELIQVFAAVAFATFSMKMNTCIDKY